ncbi:CDP-alcohol phosphatidyltransferase family protein [Caulobacter sp. S45]|uniref:CDP-alcohol phosphatidyltransferase family protein n=1 Tax=Caulobacter sp. S45 TaxID=1641861 RepID=UPI001574EFC4|nr:CDP-alcohol phosphatidyltransferase family protein [Caulobacter sp. S45]
MNAPSVPPSPALQTAPEVARPAELELWSNRRLVHPLSRTLAARLASTWVTPNMVSVAGAAMAAVGAAAYTLLPRPWGALLGLLSHYAWHVLDGADGDLARRTGRSSPSGELVDGICDYAGRTVLYVALGADGAAQFGGWVWLLAGVTGVSRIVQANFYETVRRQYRRWVYGTAWIRQTLAAGPPGGRGPAGALGRLFLAVSTRVTPDSTVLDVAMEHAAAAGSTSRQAARAACQAELAPVVRRAAILSTNAETVAVFLSMLAGGPIFLFVYVAVVLNAAYAGLYAGQRRRLARTATRLTPG